MYMIIASFNKLLKQKILDLMPFYSDINNIIYQYFYCIHMLDNTQILENMCIIANCLLCSTCVFYGDINKNTLKTNQLNYKNIICNDDQVFGCPKLSLDEMALFLVVHNQQIKNPDYNLSRKIKFYSNICK